MSEVVDAVMPLLRKIQESIGVLDQKIDAVDRNVGGVLSRQEHMSEQMEAAQSYMTYNMGITAQHHLDIAEMKARLKALEPLK